MEDFSNKELFIAIILKCVDKRSEISERLIKGYWNAILNNFFSEEESETFFNMYDAIKILLPTINEDILIQIATEVFSDDEKQYCCDLCIDVCAYNYGYSTYKETLQFATKIVKHFNLNMQGQIDRLKTLSAPDVSDCYVFTYENVFALLLPESWAILDGVDDITKVVARKTNMSLVDTFAENLNIGIEPTLNLSLDQYIKNSKINMATSFSEFLLMHEWEFKFQNVIGHFMEYVFKIDDSGVINCRCYFFIRNNLAYIISGLSTEDTASDYAEIYDEIAKSFILIS